MDKQACRDAAASAEAAASDVVRAVLAVLRERYMLKASQYPLEQAPGVVAWGTVSTESDLANMRRALDFIAETAAIVA